MLSEGGRVFRVGAGESRVSSAARNLPRKSDGIGSQFIVIVRRGCSFRTWNLAGCDRTPRITAVNVNPPVYRDTSGFGGPPTEGRLGTSVLRLLDPGGIHRMFEALRVRRQQIRSQSSRDGLRGAALASTVGSTVNITHSRLTADGTEKFLPDVVKVSTTLWSTRGSSETGLRLSQSPVPRIW